MKLLWPLVAILVVAAVITGVMMRSGEAPRPERDVVVEQFLTVLPPNLNPDQRDEIWRLFQSLFNRNDRGLVDRQDVETVLRELRKHIDRGYIVEKDLTYVMAMVGHFNYKNDPNFNTTDAGIDHPILNPEAGKYPVGPDSSFWEEFEAWKKKRADSLAALADTT